MRDQKIMVTGATGLIGSHLALALAHENRVFGLARFSNPALRETLQNAGVTPITFDAAHGEVAALPNDFDYIFHELVMWHGDWAVVRETNVNFIGKLMEHCRSAKGCIIGSTGGVYPPSIDLQSEESTLGSTGQYGVSTLGKEFLVNYLCERRQIPTVILRYYWPYSTTKGVPFNLKTQIMASTPIDLSQSRQYQPLYIDDCVQATIAAAGHVAVPVQVFNVGGAEIVTHRELACRVGEALGITPTFLGEEPPKDHLPSHLGDFTKMHNMLGVPQLSLDEGIRRVATAQ